MSPHLDNHWKSIMPDEEKIARPEPAFVERRRWPRVSQVPLGISETSMSSLMPLRFETESLPPSQQFAAWREHISVLVDARLPDNADPEDGFAVRQAVWDLNGMLFLHQTVPAFSYERTPDMARFSPIDHWAVTFLRTGRTWTGLNGHVAQNEPGMMEVRSLAQPFIGRAVAAESITLIIPDDQFFEHGGLPSKSNNIVFGGRRVKFLFDHLTALEANLDNLTKDDLPNITSRVRGMVFDTVTPFLDSDGSSDQISQVGLMTRARLFIRNNLTSSDLTPDSLARELAISRTRLYELFEGLGGVAKYIRQQRLSAARAMLKNSADTRTINEISTVLGYDSPANFSRAFTQQFGYSPTNVRKNTSGSDRRPQAKMTSSRTFESLLKSLR